MTSSRSPGLTYWKRSPNRINDMTTPTVTELVRNGNRVTGQLAPAGGEASPSPSAAAARSDVPIARQGSHLRVAPSSAERPAALPLAA
jgi:hypothetical protein